MDAIIGRYRLRIEEMGLIITYGGGISFELTPEETLGLFDFLSVYQQTLITLQQHELDTEPRLESIVLNKEDTEDTQS